MTLCLLIIILWINSLWLGAFSFQFSSGYLLPRLSNQLFVMVTVLDNKQVGNLRFLLWSSQFIWKNFILELLFWSVKKGRGAVELTIVISITERVCILGITNTLRIDELMLTIPCNIWSPSSNLRWLYFSFGVKEVKKIL